MQLTPLAVAALAVFAEHPRHAYDVYATMRQRREDTVVKLSAGTLYHTVSRMAEAELLEAVGTETAGNRPERTVYAITAPGRTALADRVRELLREPIPEYPHFPVAVAEMHTLPADEAAGLLLDRVATLQAELSGLQLVADHLTEQHLPERVWLDTRYRIAMLEAELAWCRTTADAIGSGELDWTTHPQEDDR